LADKVFENATILLVDDKPENLGILFHLLSDKGASVLIGQSGVAALEIARQKRPDIILLDVLMPELNGFETCRRLKKDSHIKDIPVLFISALSDQSDKLQAFRSGGVDYITKPFSQDEVLARITAHLTIVNQRRQINFFIENSPSAIVFMGVNGEIHFYNRSFRQLMEAQDGELEGKNFFDCLHTQDRVLFNTHITELARGISSAGSKELRLVSFRKNPVDTLFSLSFMSGEKEVMLSLQDITEKKKLEQQKSAVIQQFKEMYYQLENLEGLIFSEKKALLDFDAYGVTPKEREVIAQLKEGKNNQEIADSLYVSVSTAKKHLYSIYKKFNVKSRMELIQLLSK